MLIQKGFTYLREHSGKSKLFFAFIKYFTLQFIVYTIIVCIAACYLNRKNNDELIKNACNRASRIGDMSDMIYTQVDRIAATISVDKDVERYLHGSNALFGYDLPEKLSQRLVYYKCISNCVDSIYIYSPEYRRLCGTNIICQNLTECREFRDYSFFEYLEKRMDKDTWIIPRKIGTTYPRVISLVKKTANGGFVVVNVSYENFLEAMNPVFDQKARLYILEDDKNVVFPEDRTESETACIKVLFEDDTNSSYYKRDGFFYSQISIKYFGQIFVVRTDVSEYAGKQSVIIRYALIALLCFAMISVLIAYLFSVPSVQLVLKMYEVLEDKNFDLSDMSEGEEKQLVREIIRLVDNNREFKKNLDLRLQEYNKSQIMALQKQITPHFLNNVLSIISYKISMGGDSQAQALKMIVLLTRIIRYGSNTEVAMVPLGQEIDFISDYILILKEQYGDFRFEMEIPEELCEKKILRLSVQPFVENAVYHGIADMRGRGLVRLSAKTQEGGMVIQITDNGCGIDPETLDFLNHLSDQTDSGSHVGIYNTFKRMRVVYCEEASLHFESDGKTYTTVTIRVPLEL